MVYHVTPEKIIDEIACLLVEIWSAHIQDAEQGRTAVQE